MLIRYSLLTYPEMDPSFQLQADPEGEWIRATDVIAAMGGVAREIGASPSDDPGTVLTRATVALEARRERIVELETELARRNRIADAMIGGGK